MTDPQTLIVPDQLDAQRVDRVLANLLGISRSRAADLATEGLVVRGGSQLSKSSLVAAGDQLTVSSPTEHPVATTPEPTLAPSQPNSQLSGELEILHSDDDIIVIDKPAGVAAHAGPGWSGPTVLELLADAGVALTTHGPPERQGIVHRLDAGTSGVMVLAKSNYAYSVLKNAFRDREVDKVYHALVQGFPDPFSGTINAPIARRPGTDFRFGVCAVGEGRPSVTHYDLLEAFRYASLLEVQLETGRTHQIRVHMQAIGHPCVGDPTYGADPKLAARLGLQRQWLHAVKLSFIHPGTAQRVVYESQYAADLQTALDQLAET